MAVVVLNISPQYTCIPPKQLWQPPVKVLEHPMSCSDVKMFSNLGGQFCTPCVGTCAPCVGHGAAQPAATIGMSTLHLVSSAFRTVSSVNATKRRELFQRSDTRNSFADTRTSSSASVRAPRRVPAKTRDRRGSVRGQAIE